MKSEAYELSAAVERDHWWFRARAAILDRVLARFLEPATPRAILDVGCGTGSDFALLSRWGDVVGIDAHRSAVRACREAGWNALAGDAPALPFADARFDLVACFDVRNGVYRDAWAVAEAVRVAKPGALLVYTVGALPHLWGATDDASEHRRRYTRADLLALVPSRCEVLHCTYFNSVLFPLAVLSRVLERRFPPTRGAVPGRAIPPWPANDLLRGAFGLERFAVPRLRLPIGVSLLLVLRAPRGLRQADRP
jgi:SAM-dependent methyltransferase